MDLLILLLQLAWTFFIIGLFTFGGGYTALPMSVTMWLQK